MTSSGLSGSVCLQDLREANSALGGPTKLLTLSDSVLATKRIGFDSRKLCAAHNVVALSKCADSISMASVHHFVRDFIELESLQLFLVDVIRANPQDLDGTLIDEVAQIVKFRFHDLDSRRWQESVLLSL